MNLPTIDLWIKRKLELKDKLESLSKQFAEYTKADNEAMAACDQVILMLLNQMGVENVKTEYGTAYKSTVVSPGVDPDGGWDKLVAFVLKDILEHALEAVEDGKDNDAAIEAVLQSPALSFFVRNVAKSAVTEYSEQNNGALPPGVKSTSITRANVRRS